LVDCVGVIGIDFGVVIEFVDCVLLGKLVSIVDEVICVFEFMFLMFVSIGVLRLKVMVLSRRIVV